MTGNRIILSLLPKIQLNIVGVGKEGERDRGEEHMAQGEEEETERWIQF